MATPIGIFFCFFFVSLFVSSARDLRSARDLHTAACWACTVDEAWLQIDSLFVQQT